VLQCVAVCCSVLQCAAVRCGALQCAKVCCSVLQCVALSVSVLGKSLRLFCQSEKHFLLNVTRFCDTDPLDIYMSDPLDIYLDIYL